METPHFKGCIHHKLSLLLCDSAIEAESWLKDLTADLGFIPASCTVNIGQKHPGLFRESL